MKKDSELIGQACQRVREDTGFEGGAEIKTTRFYEVLGVGPVRQGTARPGWAGHGKGSSEQKGIGQMSS